MRTPEDIQQARDTLRCVRCDKLTTRTEAEQRVIANGRCGAMRPRALFPCGGLLISAEFCGSVHPESGAICYGDRGHDGRHNGRVDW